jgi:hypothetical protein
VASLTSNRCGLGGAPKLRALGYAPDRQNANVFLAIVGRGIPGASLKR